ncbi:MAG TPA: hypothetical protein VGZ90_13330 [Puia sp.]|jgi:hypothetical protein|nr:hypothetical protein [Puia sp.]
MNNENTVATDRMSFTLGKGCPESLLLEANVLIELFDKYGNKKDERQLHNTVTAAGKAGLLDQSLAAPTLAKAGWMAIGTGSPAATLLGAEIARVVFDSKTRSTNVLTMITTFPAGTGTGALTEEGLFDVVTANTVNMWCSSSFSVVNKGASDILVITHTLSVN